MNQKLSPIILLCTSFLAGNALAGFDHLDTDADGAVSLSELQAVKPEATTEKFARMDLNNDGLLQKSEIEQSRRIKQQERFAKYDTSGDGLISFTELQSVKTGLTEDRFARLDSNGDGSVDPQELIKAKRNHHKYNRFETHDLNQDGALSLAELQSSKPGFTLEKFNTLDTVGDGLLNRAEMAKGKQQRNHGYKFAKLDTDGSGGLSLSEIQVKKPDMTVEQFNQRDIDGNGELARGEGRPDRHPPRDMPTTN